MGVAEMTRAVSPNVCATAAVETSADESAAPRRICFRFTFTFMRAAPMRTTGHAALNAWGGASLTGRGAPERPSRGDLELLAKDRPDQAGLCFAECVRRYFIHVARF